jgi:hypothetical protein
MVGKNIAELGKSCPRTDLGLELCACCEILAFSAGTRSLAPQIAGVTTL